MTWRDVLSTYQIQEDSTEAVYYTFRGDPSYNKYFGA